MIRKYSFLLLFLISCSSTPSTLSSSTTSGSGDETANTFILPVDGEFANLHLTDSFGPRILNGVYDFHRGLDIARSLNDPIYAAAAGTVIHAGTKASFPRAGTFIILEHTNNQFTGYLHLNAIAAGVTEGATVTQGQLIGYAGDSGQNVNSVHLHFNYYVSTVSGEIPSDTDDTYPPLEILSYPDTSNHTVAITNVNDTFTNSVSIIVHTSVPVTEMDLNEVNIVITNAANTTLYSKRVNYADRVNCGTDEAETNNIHIIPEDFVYPEPTYDIDFTFEAIDLSTYTGQTLTITTTAIDISGNKKVDTEDIIL